MVAQEIRLGSPRERVGYGSGDETSPQVTRGKYVTTFSVYDISSVFSATVKCLQRSSVLFRT